MLQKKIKELLEDLSSHRISVEEAMEKLRLLPFEQLEEICIDHHRALRKGFPEVVFGEGKSPDQIVKIMERMAEFGENVLVTRVDKKKAMAVLKRVPRATYHPSARALTLRLHEIEDRGRGEILVIAAGTSDLPVAEEAALTATMMGNAVSKLYDVGVSGLHRLLGHQERIYRANVLIVVAGMEGALPSVVGGLVARPVIAVPTSVGYGASFRGLAALLAMLNSCAPNVAVVNIDNGFGAGYIASLINRKEEG